MVRKIPVFKSKDCKICKEPFTSRSDCCSEGCRVEAQRLQRRSYGAMFNRKIGQMVSSAKHRSEKYSRDFDIDAEFIKELYISQEGRCSLTNELFELRYSETHKHSPNSPSLDQIEAGKGYLKDNVRLVTYQCNIALNQWGEERLIEFAKKVLGIN